MMNLPKWLTSFDISGFAQSLREVVADPTSNIVLAVLLLGIVSLILLILVIFILFILSGSSSDEDEEEELEEYEDADDEFETEPATAAATEPPSRFRRAILAVGAVLVPVLIVAAVIGGYVITAENRYCISCHSAQLAQHAETREGGKPAKNGLSAAHGRVRCVSCHEGPQLVGALGNSADRLRHLARFVLGVRDGHNAVVDPRRCLACHESIATGVFTNKAKGVKVSHAEPISKGAGCRECHADAGHYRGASGPGMSACLRCHDDKAASAACATCHIGEPSLAAVDQRTFVPQQIISKGDCSGCHDQKKCDACHGLRMPHDITFLAYEHARSAGFDKKVLCWRCHVEVDCSKCHQTSHIDYWGHTSGTSWKKMHQTIVPPGVVAGCGCHGRSPYVKSGQDYCLACHDAGIRRRAR